MSNEEKCIALEYKALKRGDIVGFSGKEFIVVKVTNSNTVDILPHTRVNARMVSRYSTEDILSKYHWKRRSLKIRIEIFLEDLLGR